MNIKAVSFDLWFTILWENDKELEEYQRHRVDALYKGFKKYGVLKKTDLEEYYNSTSHIRMYISNYNLIRMLSLMLGLKPKEELVEYITKKYIESTFYWIPYINKEALNVIPVLKDEYRLKLAVLSNTSFSSEALHKLLENIGLDEYFDVIISSSDIEAVKPMKKAFETVSNALSLNPEHILHVGDNYIEDVIGAVNAGLKAILYNGLWRYYDKYSKFKNRKKMEPSPDTIIINNLKELFNFIK